ncbi:MAG: hypothetical protein NTV34_21600 [Proteobacteria bacterium]|nr:hypothetical protein [Pseudomonadota bacterium]
MWILIATGANEKGLSHIDFMKLTIREAASKAEEWFQKPNISVIISSIISVRAEDLYLQLKKAKENLYSLPSELESSNADTLIRFNVQIFPARWDIESFAFEDAQKFFWDCLYR